MKASENTLTKALGNIFLLRIPCQESLILNGADQRNKWWELGITKVDPLQLEVPCLHQQQKHCWKDDDIAAVYGVPGHSLWGREVS